MTTALMRAKYAVATSALALSALHLGEYPTPPAPSSVAQAASPRTVSMAVKLAASVTEDGSSQTVGVADAYLYTLNQADLVTQLNQIRSLGVTDLRIVVPWIYIQPTSATAYDWTKMDNVVNTARAMGFSMTASITMNPPWNGTPLIGAPDPDTYATFAAAVAQRYGTSIAAYEIWNEPNAVTFLAPADPRAYTAMLKAAYTAIKAVAPGATVIAGVLGAVTTVPGMSLAPQQFLAGMYAAGAQGFFDALSFHPYNYTLPFSAGAGVTNSPLEQVKALYALMTANGDSALKIWATEFGNPTSPGGINQTQQAQMLRDFVTAWSKLPFAGPAYVYTAADLNSGYLLDENNFGLFTTNGIPKLAAQTLATLISQLANGTLPNYTAPGMSAPQTIWIQLVSTAIAVVNQVLLIPNVATGILYNAAPRVLQQAFSAVAHTISMTTAQTLNAITPAAETGIGLLINFPTSVHAAAATIGANFYGTELTVQRALASVGIGTVPNATPPVPTAAIATAEVPAKDLSELPAGIPKPSTTAESSTALATATSETASPASDSKPVSITAPATATPHSTTPVSTTPVSTTPVSTSPTLTSATDAAVSTSPATPATDDPARNPASTASAAVPTNATPATTPKTTGAPAASTPPKTTTAMQTSATKRITQNGAKATKPTTAPSAPKSHESDKPSTNEAHHNGKPATAAQPAPKHD